MLMHLIHKKKNHITVVILTTCICVAETKCFLFITGCIQTIAIIGPVFGFLLGSLCAKIYVDVGYVDMGE